MKKQKLVFESLHEFLLENSNYQETSWTIEKGGREITIGINDIQKYLDNNNISIKEIPVNTIADMCIHKDKKDKKTLKRAQEADLKYPIIIARDSSGKYTMILDGHHRLKKAIDNGLSKIRARIIDLEKAPEEYKLLFA
jgi:hypothetical protein